MVRRGQLKDPLLQVAVVIRVLLLDQPERFQEVGGPRAALASLSATSTHPPRPPPPPGLLILTESDRDANKKGAPFVAEPKRPVAIEAASHFFIDCQLAAQAALRLQRGAFTKRKVPGTKDRLWACEKQ